jgi:hypothetical protein
MCKEWPQFLYKGIRDERGNWLSISFLNHTEDKNVAIYIDSKLEPYRIEHGEWDHEIMSWQTMEEMIDLIDGIVQEIKEGFALLDRM